MPAAVRLVKIGMVLGLGAFAFLVAFNNVTDYGSNFAFVRHVLSMDTTFEGNAAMWRAITSPLLHHLGYGGIIAGEALTAALLFAGAVALWRARKAPPAAFDSAKTLAILGCFTGFLLWFVGFIVIGGEWFLMWQSPTWNGQQTAFLFIACILLVLIFLNQPERA